MDPLLKLLEEHALRTPVDLSKMLNLPADEVQRRVKQYEDDKVILGYKAVINDDKVDTDLVKASFAQPSAQVLTGQLPGFIRNPAPLSIAIQM